MSGNVKLLIPYVLMAVSSAVFKFSTSIIAGYGALQSDDLLHSYTVAKCTQDIDWDAIENNILCELIDIKIPKLAKNVIIAEPP